MNELTLAELKVSQGRLPRVTQGQTNEEEKRPINSSWNKHANDVGNAIRGLTLNELTLAELKENQGGSPRVTQGQANEEKKRPINSSGNKHAYEGGKTTTQ